MKPAGRTTNMSAEALWSLAQEVLDQDGLFEFVAMGHSMYPAIADGDKVTLRRPKADEPRIGQVLFVETADGPRLHRLIDQAQDQDGKLYLVRGDAQASAADKVRPPALAGLVMRIRRPWQRWLSPGFWRRLIAYKISRPRTNLRG